MAVEQDPDAPALNRKTWQTPEIVDVQQSSPMMGGFQIFDEPINEDGGTPTS